MNNTKLNLDNPLVYLQAPLASQFEVASYMFYFVLGAYMWDLATNLNSDYYLLFRHRIRLTTIAYYVSRIMTLAYIITSTVFQTGSVGSCQALQVSLGFCFSFAMGSTSLLFFLRVRAVFIREKAVVLFFFILWLALVGTLLLVPFSIAGAHVGPTRACINTVVKPRAGASTIVTLVNDSLIFLAISHRILSASSFNNGTIKGMMSTFLNTSNLPAVSRALLQGGQQYYLITVGANIVLIILLYSPNVPALEHAMFTVPNSALANVMACIVFRQIKFGLIAPDGTSHFDKSIVSQRDNGGDVLPRFANSEEPSSYTESSLTTGPYGIGGMRSVDVRSANGVKVHMDVTKTIEHDGPVPLEILLPNDLKRGESYEMESRSGSEK